jgi:Domain of unknown function (DUF4349)
MKFSVQNRFWKIGMGMIGIFALMFILRLIYGYANPNGSNGSASILQNMESMGEALRKNYASEKKMQDVSPNAAMQSQKYEKTATVNAKSNQFEEDEKILRGKVKSFNAIIQYENSTGKKGNREIRVVIGVQPEKFDDFYIDVQKIGKITSLSVSKTDKTNEFKELNAHKLSLEKTLASLNELKQRGGGISDFVGLHDKILEIETKLQELGVQLGNFDAENEFCTVRFSLIEGQGEHEITLFQRLKVAFEWTIKNYFFLMMGLACALVCVFLILLILDKLKIFKALLSKMNE